MSENQEKSKRRWANYSIYPRFQFSIVAFNLFILVSAIGMIYYQLSKSFWAIETYSKSLSPFKFGEYKEIIDIHFQILQDAMITSVVISTVFIILYNIVFTHKSSGAIHHLREYFREVIEKGHTRKLSFRQGDLHPELPELVNKAIERIEKDAAQNKGQ